jgi:ABC-type molybdate transport system substrate-binding protein
MSYSLNRIVLIWRDKEKLKEKMYEKIKRNRKTERHFAL